MLEKIKEILESFNMPNYYGLSTHNKNKDWNYFVFNRSSIGKSGTSKRDFKFNYQIHIIMEEYIPEGFGLEVIKAIEDGTKLKLADKDHVFNYMVKPNTEMVVEMLTLEFTRPKKVCDINV